ncbi:MAG: hypothetical protein V4590_10335 [Bacteroidota bacterium]
MRCHLITLSCILLLPICFLSCFAGQPEECSYCSSSEDGKNYGKLSLNDSNDQWLSFCPLNTTIPTLRFTNDNGFSFNYSATKGRNDNKVILNTRYEKQRIGCCTQTAYQDLYLSESETMSYKAKDGGPAISLQRKINPDFTITDSNSMKVNSLKEYLLLVFNSRYYSINTDTTFVSTQQKFHSQLTLKSRTFNSVFQIIDTQADPNSIIYQGFYFSYQKGLLGYYLTNGELWLAD